MVVDGRFVDAVKKAKVEYRSTVPLHSQGAPDLEDLPHLEGKVIKLPAEGQQSYLQEQLEISSLMRDD